MCYSELFTKKCEACRQPRAFEKHIEHKCFQVLKKRRGYGRCGRKEGPYKTAAYGGLCPDCKERDDWY